MSNELKRNLNLFDAVSIVAGSMIGCAIFIVPADIARRTNSALLLLIVWLIAGIITLTGSLCYGELSASIKEEGGQYIYLEKIYNRLMAFLYGWTLFFVIQTGTLAAVTVAFAKFIGFACPLISSNCILFSVAKWHFTTEKLVSILTVLFLTFVNARGTKQGVFVQNLFTVTKVLSIVLIIILGITMGVNFDIIKQNFSTDIAFNFTTLKAVLLSLVGATFASITWNNVTFISSEIKEPEWNIPKALLIGSSLVIALYLFVNVIYVGALPLANIQNATNDIVAGELIRYIMGYSGTLLITAVISVSAFGCANGMILTGARVYYKMAKDGLFLKSLAVLDDKRNVPKRALYAQAAWICLLILWGNYLQLLDYVIYASLIFYIITIAGIFILRLKHKEIKPVYKVPTFIPVLFLILSSAVIIALSCYKPLYTIPGLLITLAGIPIYYFQHNRK